MNRSGQVALFVIIAVVIVGLVIVFVSFRGSFSLNSVPKDLAPVFSYYQSCLERETHNAAELAGAQGGHIAVGTYTPGSSYAPFGSHLSYLGYSIPYWYTITGNNVARENLPTKATLEQEIGQFVADQTSRCDFSSFYEQGYYIDAGTPTAKATLGDTSIDLEVTQTLTVSRGDVSSTQQVHRVSVPSKLGSFYTAARALYAKEKSEAFLESYAVDVLRSYAPVDGVAIQCSPALWKTPEVVDGLRQGLNANLQHITFGDTSIKNKDSYFVVNQHISDHASVVYSPDWPSKIEISPASNALMMAEPIGNQQGLGILGFCYVPYHFVYDWSFPVLLRIYDGSEVFQFPVVVVIDKNLPRQGIAASAPVEDESDVCSFRQQSATITTRDINLNPVAAHLSYQCFEQTCELGDTTVQDGRLDVLLPSCVNGHIIARADNYSDSSTLFSSNSEDHADVILDRAYSLNVSVLVDGQPLRGSAVVHFEGTHGTSSVVLPDTDMITLSEGSYNVSVYVYGNSSISIPASTSTQCTKVAQGGISGFFGGTKEECFSVTVPETKIDYALRGGGVTNTYILPSELQSGKVTLYVSSLPQPASLEQLQTNLELFSALGVDMSFA